MLESAPKEVTDPLESTRPTSRRQQRARAERRIQIALRTCSFISILTTFGIVATLLAEALSFFQDVSMWEFLTGTEWTPLFITKSFGVLPLVAGTLLVTICACVIAIPVGLGSAIYLSEYAPDRVRRIVKPLLEILAGIPTVVYGYFALTFLTPILQSIIPSTNIFNAASASIAMAIMLIPMVSSLSEDAMVAVPRSLREAGYGLGATRLEVAVRVVVPGALSGIIASFILAVSRAIGETMIVTLAAGATPNMTVNPFESIQTMTAYIVQVSMGEAARGTMEYKTVFAVGLLLFVMTFAMNVLGRVIQRRYREVYE